MLRGKRLCLAIGNLIAEFVFDWIAKFSGSPKLASGQCEKVDVALYLIISVKGREPQATCQTKQYNCQHEPLHLCRSLDLEHELRKHDETSGATYSRRMAPAIVQASKRFSTSPPATLADSSVYLSTYSHASRTLST